MSHEKNEATYWENWARAANEIADDTLLEMHRDIDAIFAKAEKKLDLYEAQLPEYVAPQTLQLLQKMTETAVAHSVRPHDFYRFRVPSVYCRQAPLLITAISSGSKSFALAGPQNDQARWHISLDKGQDTTWKDGKGIITVNGQFISPEYHGAPHSAEVDALLDSATWSLSRIHLMDEQHFR